MVESLAGAMVGAMVGDYLLQNDWMAVGKKRSSVICAFHCFVWTWAVMMCSWTWVWWLGLWLFVTHFVIDRTNFVLWWMNNVSGQRQFAQKLSPWSVIVVDNVFHLLSIWIGFKFLPVFSS